MKKNSFRRIFVTKEKWNFAYLHSKSTRHVLNAYVSDRKSHAIFELKAFSFSHCNIYGYASWSIKATQNDVDVPVAYKDLQKKDFKLTFSNLCHHGICLTQLINLNYHV